MFAILLAEIKRKRITHAEIAKVIGVTTQAVGCKLAAGGDFKSEEMIKIQETFFPNVDLKTLFTKT